MIQTACLRLLALGIAFLATIIYARALGPAQYGQYSYVLAWVSIFSLASTLGIPQLLVREGSRDPNANLRLLKAWSDRRILIAGIAAAAILVVFGINDTGEFQTGSNLFFLASALPLLGAISEVRAGLLQSKGFIARSQCPPYLLAPSVTLLGTAAFWYITEDLSAMSLMAFTVAGAAITLTLQSRQLRSLAGQASGSGSSMLLISDAMPFLMIGGLFLINARIDILMLGRLSDSNQVGIYTAASKLSELVGLILIISNLAIAPTVSRLYSERKSDALQDLLVTTARWVLIASIPTCLILTVAAGPIVRFVYGPDYSNAIKPLQVLAIGQGLALLAGPVGIALNMTGRAAHSAWILFLGVLVSALLNWALIPTIGGTGAAIATASSIVICSILRWLTVIVSLRVNPSAFGNRS